MTVGTDIPFSALLLSVAQALVIGIVAAIGQPEVSALIAGFFLLINTALTLVLTNHSELLKKRKKKRYRSERRAGKDRRQDKDKQKSISRDDTDRDTSDSPSDLQCEYDSE